jgi:transcriptional regulator with XRE-family HTH domain
MTIGERIKTLREWQNISQKELAKRVSCSQEAICQYESGKRLPALSQFRNLCKALRVPYETLLEGIEFPEDREVNPS